MNLATLDNLAVNHGCWLQRCSVLAKILFIFVLLGLILCTTSLPFLAGVGLVLLAIVVSNRLPLQVLLPLVLLPMIFASLFALSLGNWTVGLVIIGRAGLIALTVVLVFVTTPPLYLFGLLSAPMPEIFGELLYFTYRSLFLLWATLDNTLTAVRLRRGKEGFSLRKVRAMAQVYGMILLRAWDLAGPQYQMLRQRGLGSELRIRRDWTLSRQDFVLLAIVILIGLGWYYV